MALPDVPSPFRPAATPEQPWRWDLLGPAGEPVAVPGELAELRFVSQADAESWVGLVWRDLADAGVDAVTLREDDRVVYGPMSLQA